MTTITQTITTLPAAPNRGSDQPASYVTKADAMMAAWPTLVTEINTTTGQINTVAGEVNTNASTATTQATNASNSATLASQWATLVSGIVAATDYSSKAYAIGGTGVTTTIGAAKEWATTVGSAVITGAYSAKEWAVGTFIRGLASGGSAKDWATYTSGTVDDTGYSAKQWATKATTTVDGASYSAYQYAQNAATSAATAITSPGTSATSTTSLTIGTGTQSLTIQTGKSIVPTMWVNIGRTSAPSTTYMIGVVTSYDTGTGALVVSVPNTTSASTLGSGTYTDWTISITGAIGATGAAPSGSITTSGLTQNTNKLLGRGTASYGAIEEITLGTGLSLTGTTLDVSVSVPDFILMSQGIL